MSATELYIVLDFRPGWEPFVLIRQLVEAFDHGVLWIAFELLNVVLQSKIDVLGLTGRQRHQLSQCSCYHGIFGWHHGALYGVIGFVQLLIADIVGDDVAFEVEVTGQLFFYLQIG